ncbi:MAG: LUD domain-containing protein [Acidobacteriota bacterium]
MFSRLKTRRKVKRALKDLSLQKALKRASGQHNAKHLRTTRELPWDEYKQKARAIREKNVSLLPALIDEFTREAEKAGARVYRASTPQDAVAAVLKIATDKRARLIVKSKSMVSEEIKLNAVLEESGFRVVETDLGEWIIQLAGDRPSHITAPALHFSKEKVAEILSRRLGHPVPPDTREIVRLAREEMRRHFMAADIGISGANFAIAESGTLVIVSNEGNVRLTTTLPPVHIALVTAEKFVETLEDAAALLKALTVSASGKKLTSYVSFITGPSSTTDIEKEQVVGVHGPRELHIIILDGGRLALAEDEDWHEILYCLKCGGCMLVCPVFQSVGGHVFGGPVYPGGIGTLMTAMTASLKESHASLDFCADCKKCENFCPVGIPTGELLLKLKESLGPRLWEKGLSSLFRRKTLGEKSAVLLALMQKVWQKEGYLKAMPFSWTKGRRMPLLKPERNRPQVVGKGRKVYLFQGCLVKYFFPEVRESVERTLSHFGFQVTTPPEQVCCGAPSLHLGDRKAAAELARQNLDSFEKENPEIIITVCPTGYTLLKNHYPRLYTRAVRWRDRIQDFTAFMAEQGLRPAAAASSAKKNVYYHYPCHYLNELRLGDKPPALLRSLGFELAGQAEPPTCCGFCGVFSVRQPEISAHLWEQKKREILEKKVPLVATDCPGCLLQLRSGLAGEAAAVECLHTAEIMAGVLGKDLTP